ncbi:MAG: CDP-alcohol phosphatidyltransferase family protein [Clostridiales bacterium]|nr:CDP-alcohol phosphatidyltransferase family protein [Clostridiales bacterium]
MFIKNWKKDIFTIPNLLSLFRLVLIPVYATVYLNATQNYQFILAGIILAVSCLTDMIDGKIARKYGMITTLGKVLDPLADKLTQLTLTICLSMKYPVLYPVLGLFIMKELFQLVIGVVFLRKGKMLPGALLAGKVCTTVLFISLIALVLLPDIDPAAVTVIAVIDALFLGVSFMSYAMAYFGKNVKVRDIDTE